MNKRRHKYFRKLRYQQKLESKAHPCRTYWSHVKFYTKEPDTRDIRENLSSICWINRGRDSTELAVEKYIEYSSKIGNGKFVYYERPEVSYTIHKVQTDPRYSKRRVYYKKYSNKRIRQGWKQRGEEYQNGEYKKVFGVAWELD